MARKKVKIKTPKPVPETRGTFGGGYSQYLLVAKPRVSEDEWAAAGYPNWCIRYHVDPDEESSGMLYSKTCVPAYCTFSAAVTPPFLAKRVEVGIFLTAREDWTEPVVRPVVNALDTRDAIIAERRGRHFGPTHYTWDRNLTLDRVQTFSPPAPDDDEGNGIGRKVVSRDTDGKTVRVLTDGGRTQMTIRIPEPPPPAA